MLAAIPLLVLPVTAYAALILALTGSFTSTEAPRRLTQPLFSFATRGGGEWPVSSSDLLLAAALLVAFVELVKGLEDRRAAVANHALSIALFVGCVAAMLISPAFATSTFLLITLMVLLDLVAGFMLTVGARD